MLLAYQLIPPDGTEGETYLGENGRIYVLRFCRHNPGWAWCECDPEPAIVTEARNDFTREKDSDSKGLNPQGKPEPI